MQQGGDRPGAGSARGVIARVRHVEIDADQVGQRLDNFLLREFKGVPRSRVYRILRKGEVRINGSRTTPDYRLQAGDRVRLPPVRRAAPRAPGVAVGRLADLEACVLFEDRRLLVLDKPAGLAVHGGSGISLGVIEALRALRPDAPYLELVHRLDRETSGCLAIAKRRAVLRALHALLRDGAMEKRYLALVAGRWQLGEHLVDAPLHTAQRRGGERIVTVRADGKAATTRFRPVDFHKGATLMEIELLTGRTHQIRVHAAHAGHPIAGDTRYGDEQFNQRMAACGLQRLFLHAHALGFDWPDSGEPFQVSAPLEDHLRRVLDRV